MRKDADMKMVEEAAQKLGEHFDAVHIFVTLQEPEGYSGPVNIDFGIGNWLTRYGQIAHWMICKDEQTRIHVRNQES